MFVRELLPTAINEIKKKREFLTPAPRVAFFSQHPHNDKSD